MAGKPPRPGPPRSRATFEPGGGATGGARPPSRESYRPPGAPADAAESRGEPDPPPSRPGTHIVRASEVRAARAPEPAAAPRPAPSQPVDLKGASTGRGLKLGDDAPAVVSDAAAPTPAGDELSPFQKFAPSADQLSGAAQARSAESFQVMAIVFGLLFMIGASVLVTLLVVGVGWYTVGDMIEEGALAGLAPEQDHIGDTDVPEEIVTKTPVPGSRPKSGGGAAEDPAAAEPEPVAPTVGDGTILINGDVLFHSMEVNCPSSGIRTRASFRGNKATAYGLPVNEDCTVTFQGSQPAKASLRGNQTKSCTFNPTHCLLQ